MQSKPFAKEPTTPMKTTELWKEVTLLEAVCPTLFADVVSSDDFWIVTKAPVASAASMFDDIFDDS